MAEDRDIFVGALSGRLQALEGQVKSLDTSVQGGFAVIHKRLDELFAAENQRKGIINFAKALFTGGAIATIFEALRGFFGGGAGHH